MGMDKKNGMGQASRLLWGFALSQRVLCIVVVAKNATTTGGGNG